MLCAYIHLAETVAEDYLADQVRARARDVALTP
jgi:hypothetical protein